MPIDAEVEGTWGQGGVTAANVGSALQPVVCSGAEDAGAPPAVDVRPSSLPRLPAAASGSGTQSVGVPIDARVAGTSGERDVAVGNVGSALQPVVISDAEDARTPPAVNVRPSPPPRLPAADSGSGAESAGVPIDAGVEGSWGEGDVAAASAGSALFNTGIDDSTKVKTKGRKSADRGPFDGHRRSHSDPKRRRSSGWFRRLTMSFRSPSDDVLEGVPSPLAEVDGKVGDNAEDLVDADQSAFAAMVTPVASAARSLFAVDSASKGAAPEVGSSAAAAATTDPVQLPRSTGAALESGGKGAVSDAEVPESLAERVQGAVEAVEVEIPELVADTVLEAAEEGGVRMPEPVTERAVEAQTDEDESEYETGSNTTEGFGSDDAGDLWDASRSATWPLDRSPVKVDDGRQGSEAVDVEKTGDDSRGEDSGSDGGATTTGVGVGETRGEAARAWDGDETQASLGGIQGCGNDLPALDDREPVSAAPELEVVDPRSIFEGQSHGDDKVEEEDGTKEGEQSTTNSEEAVADDKVEEEGGTKEGEKRTTDSEEAVADGNVDGDKSTGIDAFVPPAPRSPRFVPPVPRPLAPPSVLPGSPEATLDSPLPSLSVEQQVQMPPPPKFTSSPAISEASSNKESPRAWRMSWWARASDRHRPPPPAAPGGSGDDEEAGAEGSFIAAALTAAAAGGEEAAAALSTGGAFAPSFNGGDAPAVVDAGSREVLRRSDATADGGRGEAPSSPAADDAVEAAAVAAEVEAERRARKPSTRRGRLNRPWLSVGTLADAQGRALEAAAEYLDVVGLARSCGACRSWRKRLHGEGGARQWIRCVRLADGVPERWRATFYLHILYDQPSWATKVMRLSFFCPKNAV